MTDPGPEVLLVNLGCRPCEGFGFFVVAGDERIDLSPDPLRRSEACALQRTAAENGEPDFDLVHPGCLRGREVEVHVRMTRKPEVALRLVGPEIVEHDMDVPAGMVCDNAVHEIEELEAAAPTVMARLDLAGGNIQGGKQRCCPVPLVFVGPPGERASLASLR